LQSETKTPEEGVFCFFYASGKLKLLCQLNVVGFVPHHFWIRD